MRTFLIVAGVLGLLAGGVFLAGRWLQSRSVAAGLEPIEVRVEPAARGALVEFISAPGEVEPKTKVSISARVSARIEELPYKEGDRVTRGNASAEPPVPPSLLVKLDSTELEAALKASQSRHAAQKAQLVVARAQVLAQRARLHALRVTLAEAERDLGRQMQLLETKDVSQSIVDEAQSRVDELKAQILAAEESLNAEDAGLVVLQHNIDAAEAEIARAIDNLSYTTITSPIDGVVTRLNAEVGELVVTGTMNNPGTVIMEVADLSQMVLKARVDETSVASVKPGQPANVRMEAYRDRTFEGVVSSVALANFDASMSRGASRSMNQGDGSRFFLTEILLKMDGERIFSGLTADVDIETRRYDDVIKVPSQAVLGRPADSLPGEIANRPEVDRTKPIVPVVYRYVEGKAVVAPVKIGASDLTHTVIESGLAEGDLVIVGPYKVLESLAHDQHVKSERPASTTQPAATQATTAPSPDGA